jgi:hypothetical protein
MNATTLKQSFAVATLTLATVGSAYAGDFTTLLNTGERTAGSTNNPVTDAFFISDLPVSWALKASITTDVYSPVAGSTAEVVGQFTDSVWYDGSSNSYIIGTYFQLTNDDHGITEINSIVRTGFADYTGNLSAAWTYASGIYSGAEDGYRLRDPARSDYIASYNAGTAATGAYFDADKVAIRTDVSMGEDNPNSGLYLISFSANNYSYEWVSNAVHIVQGASTNEGGRIRQDMWLSGFAVTQVPEAETYAMFMAGLGLMGAVVRRRKSA